MLNIIRGGAGAIIGGADMNYEIEGTERKFTDLLELLKFYHSYPVSHTIHGIGDPCPQ